MIRKCNERMSPRIPSPRSVKPNPRIWRLSVEDDARDVSFIRPLDRPMVSTARFKDADERRKAGVRDDNSEDIQFFARSRTSPISAPIVSSIILAANGMLATIVKTSDLVRFASNAMATFASRACPLNGSWII